jgi:ribonucleoside-diphosphate reductase alpha chain
MDTSVLNSSSSEAKPAATVAKRAGLAMSRHFTSSGTHPFDTVEWAIRDAVIKGKGGKEKFRLDGVEVPVWWEENTIGIVAEKYFRVVDGKKETSAKQMFKRVAKWIAKQGFEAGVFDSKESADIFYYELLHLLVHGKYAFNSPVWFNVGVLDHPQCSACFIQSVDDNMGSIMELARSEVMLFKGGSGTGSNLSSLRSSYEGLAGGGVASGPVSFMKGYDSFAGVTKSGGTTRRAAKMVVLNIDHPDILVQAGGLPGFITCKKDAEEQAKALYDTGKYSAEWNVAGNVYDRVGFQNANHSVRVTDDFMEAVKLDKEWTTYSVKDGKPVNTYKARELWEAISESAHLCGDPGIQFDTETNRWHTCPESGRINASNPCSEYLFLDDTACNLGSLNLMKFLSPDGQSFDAVAFQKACEVTITAKEIIVGASSYPTKAITENSHKYRTLGLGYTNLGALLTYWGLGYDSDEGRAVTAAVTAIMSGSAWSQSADLAGVLGPFSEYQKNRKAMQQVMGNHLFAANSLSRRLLGERFLPLADIASRVWQSAYDKGLIHGYRNAQTTVIAPTGTISFLMDCDTTGIEPMLGVVTYKKVVGEGRLIIPNRVIKPALQNLGYSEDAVARILKHIIDEGTIHTAPDLSPQHRSVFAEALGDYAIRPEGHVDMMAAVQPFICGGISKTVNMPKTATVADIEAIYMRAWTKHLKCIAVYRDECKLSQPISTKNDDVKKVAPILWGQRKRLQDTREAQTHKFRVGDVKGYLTPGEFPDGSLGEIFVRVSKQGSFLAGMIEAWATQVSISLQYGTPLSELVDKFRDVRFEPSGYTGNADIPIAKSLVDYVVRWLEIKYLINKTVKNAPIVEVVERPLLRAPIPVVDMSFDASSTPCRICGGMTKRTGACYTCTSCGETTGCG